MFLFALPFLFGIVLATTVPDPAVNKTDRVCVAKALETAQNKSFGSFELENLLYFEELKKCN